MILFTHLKIIVLQCFQFSIFSFSKISSIQTDPKSELKYPQPLDAGNQTKQSPSGA